MIREIAGTLGFIMVSVSNSSPGMPVICHRGDTALR